MFIMKTKFVYILPAVLMMAFSCDKLHEPLTGADSLVRITTSWDMISTVPSPKTCDIVYRDTLGNYQFTHRVSSGYYTDTVRNGAYVAYGYYFKDGSMTIENLENYRETRFVIPEDANGKIKPTTELYTSEPTQPFKTNYFNTGGFSHMMKARFTVVEINVKLGENYSGITSCDMSLNNVYTAYDVYSDDVLKDHTATAEMSMNQLQDYHFLARGYYLGFDGTQGNVLTLTCRTGDGKYATQKINLSDKLDSFSQVIRVDVNLYCDTDDVTGDRFVMELGPVNVENGEDINM